MRDEDKRLTFWEVYQRVMIHRDTARKWISQVREWKTKGAPDYFIEHARRLIVIHFLEHRRHLKILWTHDDRRNC